MVDFRGKSKVHKAAPYITKVPKGVAEGGPKAGVGFRGRVGKR